MNRKNILVFPCGSEIGLEVYRSLRYSAHLHVIGANSVDDHGKFVFADYVGGLPDVEHPDFIARVKAVVADRAIDAIYPTMDKVIFKLMAHEADLGCKVISSPLATAKTCISKKAMYSHLGKVVKTPIVYGSPDGIKKYPVFVKPDNGYGSRGARKIKDREQLDSYIQEIEDGVVMEFLPGPEYTVDCFTNYKGELLFAGPRRRSRIMNGISVNSASMTEPSQDFAKIVGLINKHLIFRGAWFCQLKENANGELVLLEVAARLGGTSSTHRVQGVNFALLSVFDAFQMDVQVIVNKFHVEVDRALDNKFKIDLDFDTAYIDLDDTLIVDDKINLMLIAVIHQFIGQKKKVILLTRHDHDVEETLSRHRISGLFDEIIHLKGSDQKADYIRGTSAIFIDDSFAERKAVWEKWHIAVFAPDAVESLLK